MPFRALASLSKTNRDNRLQLIEKVYFVSYVLIDRGVYFYQILSMRFHLQAAPTTFCLDAVFYLKT